MATENTPDFPYWDLVISDAPKIEDFDWSMVINDVPKIEDFGWDEILFNGVKNEEVDDYFHFVESPKMMIFDDAAFYTPTHTPADALFGAFAELPKGQFMTVPVTPTFDFSARVPVQPKSIKHAVDYVNKYQSVENHLVFKGDNLYLTPAKDTLVTVEVAEQKIQEAQDELDRIAASDVPGGTMWYWSKNKESWQTIRGCL